MSENTWSLERILALITTFAILLLPTIGLNVSQKVHPITENTFMWPWLIIVYLQPQETIFMTEMYNFILPPYSLVVFVPFLIALRLAYDQFQMKGEKEKIAGYITLAALFQIFLIWLTYQSQERFVSEDILMLYIPQILIILLQGFFGAKWYFEKVNKTLNQPHEPIETPPLSDDPAMTDNMINK